MRKLLLCLALFCAPVWGAVDSAFQPGPVNTTTGTNTASAAITGTAQNITCDVTQTPGNFIQYRLVPIGTQNIFFNIGSKSNSPATATTSSQPMIAGVIEIFSGPPNMVISVIASTTGTTLYCTAGSGV